jgi:hypothetical protein
MHVGVASRVFGIRRRNIAKRKNIDSRVHMPLHRIAGYMYLSIFAHNPGMHESMKLQFAFNRGNPRNQCASQYSS